MEIAVFFVIYLFGSIATVSIVAALDRFLPNPSRLVALRDDGDMVLTIIVWPFALLLSLVTVLMVCISYVTGLYWRLYNLIRGTEHVDTRG